MMTKRKVDQTMVIQISTMCKQVTDPWFSEPYFWQRFTWFGFNLPTPTSQDNTNCSSSTGSGIETLSGVTHGFPIIGRHGSLLHQHHHVGSAPSGIPFEGHFGHYHECPETFFMSPPAYGGVGIGHINRGFLGSRRPVGNGSPSFRTMSSPRISHMLLGSGLYAGLGATNAENMSERGRNRRADQNGNQTDSKKQFQLDLDKITSVEDTRTTLMIKNDYNKYEKLARPW
ncbi:hypothetical protein L1987_06440 [Smallanthus sonchifolius]|uniref:Uncharacterized protein n=1 Tax=Smallanthus sonchifolius TaxID=185202 RepID=A0ACB9JY62_9ASTR|nr:hypothetical protein L1987_06440 [Smallanthus sonchifolius]